MSRRPPVPTPILRFSTGKVVDYSTCPLRVQAHGHWRQTDTPVEPGQPNSVCLCSEGATTP